MPFDKFFFSKSFDWIGEQEYRYVWGGDLEKYDQEKERLMTCHTPSIAVV